MITRAIVVSGYTAKYTDPIAFRGGDHLTVHRADSEFIGWYWCTNAQGKEGWVHASYLSATAGAAVGLRDFTAAELTVSGAEEGMVLDRLGGWVYFQTKDGRVGWVPENCVRPNPFPAPSAFLRWNLLITDIGFILYWAAAAMDLFPSDWLYQDHDNPILVAWNWSFAPVDLAASFLGLSGLALARRKSSAWTAVTLLSAALTFCAGLMAVAFWALRRDFDPAWWAPNLYLLIWPCIALAQLLANLQTLPATRPGTPGS